MTKASVLLAMSLILAGCVGGYSPREVVSADPTSIEQSGSHAHAAIDTQPAIFTSPDTSFATRQTMGDRYAEKILAASKRSGNVKLEAALQAVVDDLQPHVSGDRFDYKVYLLEDPQANAFTSGGGHLFVTTGLISALRSEGQVAAVLAHEMAHNASAHVVKSAHNREIVKQTEAFSENVMDRRWGVPWLGNGIAFLVATGVNTYTRQQEDEADEVGLHAIVKAGYDPHETHRAVAALVAGKEDQSEIRNFFFGRHSTARARMWRFKNLIRAYYPTLDVASRMRSTPRYDALAADYRQITAVSTE